MVVVAQLVRAPDCGSGGRGFETHLPPEVRTDPANWQGFLFDQDGIKLCLDDRKDK